jgi:FlaA1/EpsC-like NDP-sugar epimerase
MKKLLFALALVLSATLFGQTIIQSTNFTNYTYSQTMRYNMVTEEYEFEVAQTVMDHEASWEFTLDMITRTGFVKSGSVVYTVESFMYEEREFGRMLIMKVMNQKLQEPMVIIAGKTDAELWKVALYAPQQGISWVFFLK